MQTDPHVEETWSRITDDLRAAFPDSVYRVWLSALRPLRIDRGTIYLTAPNETCDWVRRRFGTAVAAVVCAGDPALQRVEIVAASQAPAAGVPERLEPRPSSLKLNRSFANFVIGDGNRFAHAAALTVAELPGQSYNPLLLYGPPGVGKSHLLQAIGSYVVAHDATARVHYTTVELFTADFTRALRSDGIDDFKRTYRNASLLLLDDVQFLAGKHRTSEELLHTLDVAIGAGAQIVLTADRHPGALPDLNPRLKERLLAGLVIDVPPAAADARLAIARKLAVPFPSLAGRDDVLEQLARALPGNAHTLSGALTRLAAYASLTGAPVTTALAEEVLAQLYPTRSGGPSKRLSVPEIQRATAARLEVPVEALRSAGRGRRLVYARQLAMYLCRELTALSLPAIAAEFGGRDHTTVLHAHRKLKTLLLTDSEIQRDLRAVTDDLTSLTQGPHTTPAPDVPAS